MWPEDKSGQQSSDFTRREEMPKVLRVCFSHDLVEVHFEGCVSPWLCC